MRPKALLTLRCPRRCHLGSIVATTDGPRIVLTERVLVAHDVNITRAERQHLGPFTLEELHLSYGCRHAAGDTLDEHMPAIREALEAVRRGDTRIRDFVIAPPE